MPARIEGLTVAARSAGMTRGGYVPSGSIAWRLGQIHVGTSALTVAREFWRRRAKGMDRRLKRAIVRVALREHRKNRELYNYVMRGRS